MAEPSITKSEVEDRLLDFAEVSRVLGVCARSVRRAVDRGELPKPVRVGRSVRLFKSDVEAYLRRLREQRGLLV